MHLVDVETLTLVSFQGQPPDKYAILSHTWRTDAAEEVQYSDIMDGGLASCPDKPGKFKVEGCCRQAKQEGYRYVWIDSCCINQHSAVELSTAINSMYRWYWEAGVCYVYMADVPAGLDVLDAGGAFSKSRWFRRGWTLQELLAPRDLHFFNMNWDPIATKQDIASELETITRIPLLYLFDFDPTTAEASAAQRMSWAANRVTTREEDVAYCLLGLFDVNLNMIYGEGARKAFVRLQQAIMEKSRDDSIFAWGLGSKNVPKINFWGLQMKTPTIPDNIPPSRASYSPLSDGVWASTPSDFANCANIVTLNSYPKGVCTFASGFIHIDLVIAAEVPSADVNGGSSNNTSIPVIFGVLNCGPDTANSPTFVGLPLWRSPQAEVSETAIGEYIRLKDHPLVFVDGNSFINSRPSPSSINIRVGKDAERRSQYESPLWWYGIRYPRVSLHLAETYPKSFWRGSNLRAPDHCDMDILGPHRKKIYVARFRSVEGGNESPEHDIAFVLCVGLKTGVEGRGQVFELSPHLLSISKSTDIALLGDCAMDISDKTYTKTSVRINNLTLSVSLCKTQNTFIIKQIDDFVGVNSLRTAESEIRYVQEKRRVPEMLDSKQRVLEMLRKACTDVDEKEQHLQKMTASLEYVKAQIEKLKEKQQELEEAIKPISEQVGIAQQRVASLLHEKTVIFARLDKITRAAAAREIAKGPGNWLARLLVMEYGNFTSCVVCQKHYGPDEAEAADNAMPTGNATTPPSNTNSLVDGAKEVFSLAHPDTISGQGALFCAVVHGDVMHADLLIEAGASPNGILKHQKNTLLVVAIENGNMDMVRLLVEQGAQVNQWSGPQGYPPLWHALWNERFDAADFLLSHGVNIESRPKDERSLLIASIYAKHTTVVRFLVDRGVNIYTRCAKRDESPLMAAAKVGKTEVFKILLSKMDAVEDKYLPARKWEATEIAVRFGRTDIVHMLFASPNVVHGQQFSTLIPISLEVGDPALVNAIFRGMRGEDHLDWTSKEATRIKSQAITSGNPELVKILLYNGCPNSSDLVATSVKQSKLEVASFLLRLSVDIKKNPPLPFKISSFLFDAVRNEDEKMVRLLLEYGADPNVKPGFRDTPLKAAKALANHRIFDLMKAHLARASPSSKKTSHQEEQSSGGKEAPKDKHGSL